jgi:hypothetical protein
MSIPITYWLELVRRSLYPGQGIEAISGMGQFSALYILLFLAVSTLVFLALSLAIFRYADGVARRKGKIDMSTTY